MGARNVAAAFSMWPHLPHAQFRLLVGMALGSLDAPSKEGRPARVYFGGEDALVDLLGRSRSTTYEVLASLKAAGAIEVLEPGRHRRRAVYRLALDPFADLDKGPGGPDAKAKVQGPGGPDATGSGSSGHEGSGWSGREGSRSSGPLGTTEEGRRKSRSGDTSSPKVTHQGEANPGGEDEIDYSAAYKIVEAALGIEAAAGRIRELAADGADYTDAMVTLARQISEAKP